MNTPCATSGFPNARSALCSITTSQSLHEGSDEAAALNILRGRQEDIESDDDDDGEEGGEHDGRLSAKDKEARQRQQRRDLELAATVLDGDSDDEGGAANLGDDNQQDDDGAELPFSFMRAEAALDLHDEPGWGSNGGSSNPGFDVASAGDDDPLQPCSLSKSPGAALEDEEATQCACATRRRDAGSRQSGDRDGACAAGWRRPPMAREGTARRETAQARQGTEVRQKKKKK